MFPNEERTELNKLQGVDSDAVKIVKIILKHGGEFLVKCKNFSITETGNVFSGYSIDGISGDYPLYICTDEIAAVLYLREGVNDEINKE